MSQNNNKEMNPMNKHLETTETPTRNNPQKIAQMQEMYCSFAESQGWGSEPSSWPSPFNEQYQRLDNIRIKYENA